MTLQMSGGRGFDPVGWDLVQGEAVRKERNLRSTCLQSYDNIRDQYGGNHPAAGWSWFHKAAFHDAFDREPLVKANFPQMPIEHPGWGNTYPNSRSAGLAPGAVLLKNIDKHRTTGRNVFMERGSGPDNCATMSLPDGGLSHTKRTAMLSLPSPGYATPGAGRATPSSSRSVTSNSRGDYHGARSIPRTDLPGVRLEPQVNDYHRPLGRSASEATLRFLK